MFSFQFLVKTSVRKQIAGLKTCILKGVALFGTGKIEKQGRNDGIEFGVIHVPFINSAFSHRASAVYADDMRGGGRRELAGDFGNHTPSFSIRLSRGCVSRCCSMLFQPNASM